MGYTSDYAQNALNGGDDKKKLKEEAKKIKSDAKEIKKATIAETEMQDRTSKSIRKDAKEWYRDKKKDARKKKR